MDIRLDHVLVFTITLICVLLFTVRLVHVFWVYFCLAQFMLFIHCLMIGIQDTLFLPNGLELSASFLIKLFVPASTSISAT